MKTKTIAALAAVGLLPALGFAQTTPAVPPVPPTAPVPAVPPVPPPDKDDDDDGPGDRAPKVPITFLGVETSDVPNVVAEQLALAKGFGLVVDYVVPDGPAAAAGLQQNDILKMLNDQILTEPDQLGKLIRSMTEGTSVTLTVLRKGAETKLTAKLGKREVSQRRGNTRRWRNGKGFGFNLGPDFERKMEKFGEEMGQMNFDGLEQDVAQQVREATRDAQHQARDAQREAQRGAREAAREAARATRDAARAFRVTRRDNGALTTTRMDMNRAQIIYHDEQGELKLENVAGKKILTAKDPQGRNVFSGPVETKEDLDKMPAEVRQRFEKLEQKDLPALAPNVTKEQREKEASEANEDSDDDNDSAADEGDAASVLQVSGLQAAPAAASAFDLNVVLI